MKTSDREDLDQLELSYTMVGKQKRVEPQK